MLNFVVEFYHVCMDNFFVFKNARKRNKLIITTLALFLLLIVILQIHLIFYCKNIIPFHSLIIFLTLTILSFSISIYTLFQTFNLEKVSKSLEDEKTHNRALKVMQDGIRVFKHDFSNIMQAFEGYIINDDITGLKKYFKGIKKDCNCITNLEILNSNLVKDPALYSLIASKYELSFKQNISFNIDIGISTDAIPVSSYVLTRILGILFDNAIEAASVSKEKEIYFKIFKSFGATSVKKYIISIENSYLDKNIDLNKIREKGYTSKSNEKECHGIGLWEVNKILKKNDNLNLYTTKNDQFFIQQLEIFE